MTDVHARVVELLPWYVNGTLSAAEQQVVDDHVGACLPCRRALHDERSIAKAVRASAMPSAESAGLDRLLAVIDGQAPSGDRTGRPRVWSAHMGRRAALAAAACAALAALVWIGRPTGQGPQPAGYSTLSTPGTAAGPRIDLILEPGAGPDELAAIAGSLGAEIGAGPSEIGRYTLVLPTGTDVAALLGRLRDDPRVRFAGPSFIDEDPE